MCRSYEGRQHAKPNSNPYPNYVLESVQPKFCDLEKELGYKIAELTPKVETHLVWFSNEAFWKIPPNTKGKNGKQVYLI